TGRAVGGMTKVGITSRAENVIGYGLGSGRGLPIFPWDISRDENWGEGSVPQDSQRRITRRAALQLGAVAGAAATAAPYLGRIGGVFGGDGPASALAPNLNFPAPAIVTRAQWGANEGIRESGQIFDAGVSHIVVHHTGTPNS